MINIWLAKHGNHLDIVIFFDTINVMSVYRVHKKLSYSENVLTALNTVIKC